jgi:DNA-binding CsgD family transcriptional regulator
MNVDRTTVHYYLKALRDRFGARNTYHLVRLAQTVDPGPPVGRPRPQGVI